MAFINQYNVTPTVSGQSTGIIDVINVSGGTAPYSVSWSGATSDGYYTSAQWDNFNLYEGVYVAKITDAASVVSNNAATIYLSGYTLPTFSAGVTSYSCVSNPNKYCEIAVYSGGTSSLTNQSASTLNYSLYKDGELVSSLDVGSGETSTTKYFKKLTNGEYMLTIGRSESLSRNFLINDSVCTASSINLSAGTTPNIALSLSAFTSGWTKNSHFAAGDYYVGTTPTPHTTGLHNWGHVLDSSGHWFFTGDSSTGILNYPDVNPNTARTTDTTRYWYLGVSGSSDCQEGWNCGPIGPNTDPVVALTAYDLSGGTINTSAYRGTYYYHKYLNKFFVWDSTTGITNSDYAWVTYNPTADRGSKGDPVSSEIITQKDTTFQHKMIGGDDTFYIIDTTNAVRNFDSYFRGIQNNYLSTRVDNVLGLSSGDPQTASYITPCSYVNYTHDIYLYPSGNTANTASIVLHYFRDEDGTWGQSGATHYLTLDFNSQSGATVSINKGQSSRAFQRDAYGEERVSGNPEGSNDEEIREIVNKSILIANAEFERQYPDLARSSVGGGKEVEVAELKDLVMIREVDDLKKVTLSPYESFREWRRIYDDILRQGLQEYEDRTGNGEFITTTYKEFNTTILSNGPRVSGRHCSPYNLEDLSTQGIIKVRVSRTGSMGQQFKIQMTETMGLRSVFSNSTKVLGDENLFNPLYEINFDINNITTWSGSTTSAPEWVTTTSDLQRFLGGGRIGYLVEKYNGIVYGLGFTGISANYSVTKDSAQLISDSSAVTLTQGVVYTTSDDRKYKTILELEGNNNIKQSKTCDYYPTCASNLTIPRIRPSASATIQSFIEPKVVLEGVNRISTNIEDITIINLSGYGGNTPIITANTSGNTSDLLLGKSYLRLEIYPYEYQKNKFGIKPLYSYLFNTMNEVSSPQLRKKGVAQSATTIISLSGLPTANTTEYILKPSFIFKDKSTKSPTWIDNSDTVGGTTFDSGKDYYMVLVEPPTKPILRNNNISFSNNNSAVRLANKSQTVSGVPDFSGSQSAFTYSALTLPFTPISNIQVIVNGLTMKLSNSSVNTYSNNLDAFSSGDYYINENIIVFGPRTVQNNDTVQVIYPTKANRSFYNQSLVVGTPGTTNTNEIYQDSANYFINLEYEVLGGVSLILNGLILVENVDYKRVAPSRIQFLTYTKDGAMDFVGSDVINMYYLTQYDVLGVSSVKNPQVTVNVVKKLNTKEELKFVVYNGGGDVVQEEIKTFTVKEYGSIEYKFIISVPKPGTYKYLVQNIRTYPLYAGNEITTEQETRYIEFSIDNQTFYSPYKPIRGGGKGTGFGSY
tara:strand:- start:9757 stop:13716 length:3960 start_codon:yes stop_codon:yes gene_type:complete